ncbi:hypothetical protein [Fimbriiglobus ruber]|uniref:Uncharacterized protein n=1 Tax=Fimbriiglobus ruber TaxID=1908690 RepID=A0A225DZG4_9BACT|nr:hypothetical protein [Fimbriiglobus ruber]OWK46900.1 hypothetical protein FRUB_00599 [Fimbriiglobus ruber]
MSLTGTDGSSRCGPPSRVYLFSLAVALVCLGGFYWRERALGVSGDSVPDARPEGYQSADLEAFFQSVKAGPWGAKGASVYAATEVTIDFAFPLAYAGLIGCILVALYGRCVGSWLVLVAVAIVGADWTENVALAGIGLSPDPTHLTPEYLQWATVATTATVVKWKLSVVASGLIVLGVPVCVVRLIVGRIRAKKRAAAKPGVT